MNTTEEKRVAVLQFCDEVCPKTAKNPVEVNGMTLEWIDYGPTMGGGLRLYGVADWMYIDANMDDHVTLHAYRLLGLEARDAVAETRDFYESLLAELKQSDRELVEIYAKAEVGRLQAEKQNAALVEALEEINHHHGYFYANGDGKYQGRGGERVLTPVGKRILAALEANKKGATT